MSFSMQEDNISLFIWEGGGKQNTYSFESFWRDERWKRVVRRNKPPRLRHAGCHLHLHCAPNKLAGLRAPSGIWGRKWGKQNNTSSGALVPRGEKLSSTTPQSQRGCFSFKRRHTCNVRKLVPLKPLLKAREWEKEKKKKERRKVTKKKTTRRRARWKWINFCERNRGREIKLKCESDFKIATECTSGRWNGTILGHLENRFRKSTLVASLSEQDASGCEGVNTARRQ